MSTWTELEEVGAELRAYDRSSPPADKLSQYLKLVRELKVRDSASVARYGSLFLKKHSSWMSEEELWLIHEQVAIAELDSGATAEAAILIRAVAKRFPSSLRTKRLQGMYWEAVGEFEQAERLYFETLQENPSCEMMAKRLIALEKSKGNLPGVIEGLKKYLEVFANDKEAWEELSEVYIESSMYRQALFCVEELILYQPNNTHYLTRYGDLLYTVASSSSNYRLARTYFAKAVELTQGQSPRALFGVLACCANITDKVSLQDTRTRAQIELPDLTAQALIQLYRTYAPDKLPLLQPLLEKQGLC